MLPMLSALDAVNVMLSSIGQAPVNSLDVAGIRDVAIAKLSLDNTNREVQTKGWSFNTDRGLELSVDESSGHILVPHGALWVRPSDASMRYVQRADNGTQKLYDTSTHSFNMSKPVKVDVIWGFPFDDIPQAARQFIATRAARIFQANVIGSDLLFRFTAEHELEAKAVLEHLESRSKRRNVFDNASAENGIYRRHINTPRF